MYLKKLALWALLCSSLASAQISNTGLVAFYPFDGNANDYSGTGNNGTAFNTSSTANKFGIENKAYSFNGSSSYVNIGNKSSLKMTTGISISTWIYLNSVSPIYQNIISDHSSNQREVGAGKILRMAGNKVQFIVAGIYGGNSSDPVAIYVQAPLTANAWHHVMATYDKQTVKLYVNNVLIESKAYTGNLIANANNLLIGNSGFGNELLNGKLDQFRIYNRAVTTSEISSLYNENEVIITVKEKNTNICKGGNLTINAPKGYASYLWSNGVSGQDSLIVKGPGDYYVLANGNLSNTITIKQDTTTASIKLEKFVNIQDASIVLSGKPTAGTFYGNGIEDSKFIPKLAGLGASTVHYQYTGASGCKGVYTQKVIVYDTLTSACSVNDTLFMEVITSISKEEKSTIKIYPNPAFTELEISVENQPFLKSYQLDIVDVTGKPVFKSSVNNAHMSVSVSGWPKGIYLLRLTNSLGDVVENRKIVVQ